MCVLEKWFIDKSFVNGIFSDGFVCLFASQVLYDNLYYVANRGMLLTIVRDDCVDKIIVDI